MISPIWLLRVACAACLVCAATAGAESTEPASDLHAKARTEFANRNYEKAAELYKLVLDSGHALDPLECQVRLGLAYQRLEQWDDAIEVLSAALRVSEEGVSPYDKVLAQNHRAEAQWGIAICLLAKGKYELALRAIDDSATKYQPWHTCGNAIWQDDYRNALYRGLTLEYLDDYAGAVRSYLKAALGAHRDPTASIRLADLYERAEQFEELNAFARRLTKTRILRGVVELHDVSRRGDLETLVPVLLVRRFTAGRPWETHVRRIEWEAAESARLLAQHPEAGIPLLKAELGKVGDHAFVYYALGLSATEDAAMVLGNALLDKRNAPYVMTLNYALRLAGEPGEAVIQRLSTIRPDLVKYRSYAFPSHWFLEGGIDFRELPVKVRLPRFEELERLAISFQRE